MDSTVTISELQDQAPQVVKRAEKNGSVAVSRPKLMVVIGAHDTVTVSSSCNPATWAEMAVVPAVKAVTTPLLSTVATMGADEE